MGNTMEQAAKKLMEKKEEIEELKIKKTELETRYKVSLEQLKKEFNCNSIEEAEAMLINLKDEGIKLEETFLKLVKEIEDNE